MDEAVEALTERVGDPLYPEALNTQCKVCGRRTRLHIITDYDVGGTLSLGICKECHFESFD